LTELLTYATEQFSFNPDQINSWTKIANLIASVLEQRIKNLNGWPLSLNAA